MVHLEELNKYNVWDIMELSVRKEQKVIRFLFDEINLDVIFCGHFIQNRQSARVQEKCGFMNYAFGTYRTQIGTVEDHETNILTREAWLER